MDVLSSAEFRKTYAKLTEPTVVTVNGHAIGRWEPMSSVVVDVAVALANDPGIATRTATVEVPGHGVSFNTRPFTPVPKKR